MKKIGDFLERFTKIAQQSDDIKNAVAQTLLIVGVTIKNPQNITIRNGIATLKLSAIQKSEVALKQKRIIEALQKNPITQKITVVR